MPFLLFSTRLQHYSLKTDLCVPACHVRVYCNDPSVQANGPAAVFQVDMFIHHSHGAVQVAATPGWGQSNPVRQMKQC